MALIDKLNNIGDAIRSKTGTTEKMTLDEMVATISRMPNLPYQSFEDSSVEIVRASLTLPTTTEIEENAFRDDEMLVSITIPNVTHIKKRAFYNCTNLNDVFLGENLTTISGYAFQNTGITKITIPKSVTDIYIQAFYNCTNLTGVYISDIAAWCNIYFENGTSNPLNIAGNLYLNGELVTDLVIPNSVTEPKGFVFYNCLSLETVTIPNSISRISSRMFSLCTNLKKVTIPDNVTIIDNYAFSKCESLLLKELPSSITGVGDRAFSGCKSLNKIVFKSTPTIIAHTAFADCNNLTVINVPWAEGEVANAPWGAVGATINYNYTGD